MTTGTLPLFDPLPGGQAARYPTDERAGPGAARATPVDSHLRAARKLSKQIRRTVDGSPQQTKAAHLICQHLLAMLHANRIEQRPRGGYGAT